MNKSMKKYGIIAGIVVAIMAVMHILVNNFEFLDAVKRLHGG